jgi:hypothetical protein
MAMICVSLVTGSVRRRVGLDGGLSAQALAL